MTTAVKRAVAIAALALLLGAACTDDPTTEAAPEASPTPIECHEISQPSLSALAGDITVGNSTLNINTIRATEVDGWWFVAGEIDGKGYNKRGDIALWAAEVDPDTETVEEYFAVNDLAIEGSNFETAPDEVTEDDPSVEILAECVADFEDI